MNVISIAVVCLIAAILSRLIKQVSAEIAFGVSASAVIVILAVLIDDISSVFQGIGELSSSAGISSTYLAVAVKALGIGYVCDLCSASCRDSGESALASVIDISGKIAISLICMPILNSLMEVVSKILEI